LRFLAAALGLTAPCFFVVITSFVSDSLVESSTGMILFGLLAADFFAPFATDVLTLLLRDVPFEFYYFSNNI
jgi:hypothetical protein